MAFSYFVYKLIFIQLMNFSAKGHKKQITLSILLVCWLMCVDAAFGQTKIGFYMKPGVNRVEIPFEKYSNLIVVPVRINNFVTLKFILDTGAETAILTEKLYAEVLKLKYIRELTINGPGVIDSIRAYVAGGVHMSLAEGEILGDGLNLLVLEDDYLELTKNLGEEIYGILGYDFFHRFVVEIDYDNKLLTVVKPLNFKPRRFFAELPMDIVDTKPYLTTIFRQYDLSDSVRLMIDTGASHAALLDVVATDHIVLPDKLLSTQLGRGLGGEIPGFIGRIDKCEIGPFEFEKVLISVPLQGTYMKAIKRGSRHGTIGGDLLTRFHVIFDYPHEKIYLAKGRYYRDSFEFNMSGMSIITDGDKLDTLKVSHVRRDTPAYNAGIREGDHILKINGFTIKNSNISELQMLLRKRPGMKVRVVLKKGDRKVKKIFRLKKLI